jgi:hypothetical protein
MNVTNQAEKYQVNPPLTPEKRAEVKESIRRYGVLVPVEEDENGNVLDGYHRVELWQELRDEGVKVEARMRRVAEMRRDGKSLRDIAAAENVSLGQIQRDMEKSGVSPDTPDGGKVVGADGKNYPARRPAIIAKNGQEAERAREAIESAGAELLPPRLIDVRKTQHVARECALADPGDVPAVQTIGSASLRVGSLLDALADVPDNSVDLILTDPPYDAESIHLYADLGLLAARLLTDHGVLVAYHGKWRLPECLNALGQHLDYHWMLSLVHGYGGTTFMHCRNIAIRWKALLLYTRKGCSRHPRYLEDVVKGVGCEKDAHAWQQGEPEAAHLIEKLTDPGEVVVDPFLGSGTTAAAAVKLGRRFIGADINPGCVAVAQERLKQIIASEEAAAS